MATENKLIDAIEYICSVDAELYAVIRLISMHQQKHEKQARRLVDREKSLRSICKWNRHKYKDEAIDVLCDVDNYDEGEEDYD